jgi:hypothetical protein
MATVIYPQSGLPGASELGEGIAALGHSFKLRKEIERARKEQEEDERREAERQAQLDLRYQEEQTYRRGRDALTDQRYAEQQGAQARSRAQQDQQTAAEQQYNANRVPGVHGMAEAMDPQAAAGVLKMKDLVGRMSPEAGRMALQDFAKQEQGRIIGEGIVKTRRKVMNAVSSGAIAEEQAAEILQSLDPAVLGQDHKAALHAIESTDQAITAAQQNIARQEADAMRWQVADTGIQEAFTRAQPFAQIGAVSPDHMANAMLAYRMLAQDFANMTPTQAQAAVMGVTKMLEPKMPSQPEAPAAQPMGPEGPQPKPGTMPSRQDIIAPGRAKAMPLHAAGDISEMRPGTNGQTGSMDTVSRGTPQARPPGVQPMPGKRRSRTEILGGDRGPEQDPAPLHEAVAKAIRLGIPLDQFQDLYGIDLNTLTEADLKQIEVMAGKPAAKKP